MLGRAESVVCVGSAKIGALGQRCSRAAVRWPITVAHVSHHSSSTFVPGLAPVPGPVSTAVMREIASPILYKQL